ncbi:MAG TPA: efflux RND transporter periplasmic adaptor subunit, partial [Rhodanobacter sp.]
ADQVVTEGQFRLKPGSKVKALKPGEVPAAPSAADLDKAKKGAHQGGGRRNR